MAQKKHTILLAEDDQFLQRMYATRLEQSGLEVVVAGDGAKALELLKKKRPDVLVLDILMPKKDGFEVLKEVRADASLKNLPIIVLTNLGEADDVRQARKLGANDYLIKAHFLPSEVMSVIEKYLT